MRPKRKKQGRNAPCPCGSGRKSKHCCGLASVKAANLHVIDERCVPPLLEFTRDTSEGKLTELIESLPGYEDDTCLQLNVPLVAYHGEIDGSPILERYLEAHGENLAGLERSWLEGQQRAWLSIWEVLGVKRYLGLELRDLLTGETRFVHERSASESVHVGSSLLARVVDCSGLSVLCGMYPIALPPVETQTVIEGYREQLQLAADAPVSKAALGGWEAVELLELWDVAAQRLLERPQPQLQNTDGDPVLPTRDRFAFEAGAREAVAAALREVPGCEQDGSDHRFTVTRPGNAQHADWENTVVGSLELGEAELVVETNSLARADALRAAVEAAAGQLLTFLEREHTDLEELLASGGPAGGEGAPLNAGAGIPPELAAQLEREYKARHYASWPDEPLPALAGLTPRKAAELGGKARRQLETLLRDLEHHEAQLPPERRFSVAHLRSELGMPDAGPRT